MDASKQNQSDGNIQFDSKDIAAKNQKREKELQKSFVVRKKIDLKEFFKWLDKKPLLKGFRKFLWLGGAILLIAGIIVGTVVLVNHINTPPAAESPFDSENWSEELDQEIYEALMNRDLVDVMAKIDDLIDNAKTMDDKDALRLLYEKKTYALSSDGQYEAAADAYEAMINTLGADAEAYQSLANVYYYSGDYETALVYFRKALELTEEEGGSLFLEGIIEVLEKQING